METSQIFDRQFEAVTQCLRELMKQGGAAAEQNSALQALSAGLEELHVTGQALRRQNEELLAARQASEARASFLAGILERSAQPCGAGYPDGRLLDFNAAFCDLVGYSREEVPALDWAVDLTPPEWRAMEAERMAELQRTGQPVRYEKEYIRKDGSRVPVELLCHLVRDEAGALQYYYSFVTDITERKQAEAQRAAALREQEQLLREARQLAAELEATFAAQNDVVLIDDTDMNVRRANPSFLATYGFDPVGLNVRDLARRVAARNLEGQPMPLQKGPTPRALRGEAVAGVFYRVKRADGAEAVLRSSAGPIRIGDHIVGSTTVWHDITELHRAEEGLKASLAEKEVLLREIYHRVKNNLQALIHLMDMQADYISDESTRQIVRELKERAWSMALVHEKLYQSQNLAQIDFGDYLHDLVDNLSHAFGTDRPIAWRFDVEDVPLSVDMAIPCGLVVTELLTNALKYAFPAGGGQPRAERGETECKIGVEFRADGERLTLVVADNGVGLPPGLDWARPSSLGLQLINVLVRHQLGGQVEVDTHAGTTFKITFAERKK